MIERKRQFLELSPLNWVIQELGPYCHVITCESIDILEIFKKEKKTVKKNGDNKIRDHKSVVLLI